MHERRIPEWLRHAPTPGIRGFAVLAGLEAVVRGILISVFPLVMYSALGAAQVVSAVYFAVGIGSLAAGLMVPWLIRFLPRRWMYSIGALLYVVGAALAIEGSPGAAVAADCAHGGCIDVATLPPRPGAGMCNILRRAQRSAALRGSVVFDDAGNILGVDYFFAARAGFSARRKQLRNVLANGLGIDATVAASFVTNPDDSTVADSVGFALAPDAG